jgi:TRAP-type mannitol/chloroaromatic compound transport system permease small subunit
MDELIDEDFIPKKEEAPEGEPPPKALATAIRLIDTYVGELSGKIFMLLIFPLVVGSTYEVIARYVFNAPTKWAYDTSYMLYGSHFMLGAAYCLLKKGHIRTDVFYEKFSVRWQGWIDASLYIVFFFPGMILFLWFGSIEALHSWSIREESVVSPWRPVLYPFKAVIPISAALLMIQGVSELLKSLYAGMRGRWL